MSDSDRTLIDPTEYQLHDAVAVAVESVSSGQVASWQSPWPNQRSARREMTALWLEVRETHEGTREWRWQSPPGWRHYREPALMAVWWTDYLSRKHLRLVADAELSSPLVTGPSRPPLACLYPDRCVIASRHRRFRLLVVCGCGVWGEPGQLGWMGPCCGPCFDRLEGEAPPPKGSGERSRIQAVAFSPRGDRLVSLDLDGGLRTCDVHSGRVVREQTGLHRDRLRFSPDGGLLAVCQRIERRCRLLDGDGNAVWGGKLYPIAFPREGPGVIAQAGDGRLGLWEWPPAGTGADAVLRRPFQLDVLVPMHDLAVSPDGRLVAGATDGSGVLFWDFYTGRARGQAQLGPCHGPLAFSPGGEGLAAGVVGLRNSVQLFDLAAGRPRGVLTGGGDIFDFAYTPDGATLIAADSAVRAWDVRSGLERLSLSPADGGTAPISSMALSADGRWLALGLCNGEVRLWPGEMLLAE